MVQKSKVARRGLPQHFCLGLSRFDNEPWHRPGRDLIRESCGSRASGIDRLAQPIYWHGLGSTKN